MLTQLDPTCKGKGSKAPTTRLLHVHCSCQLQTHHVPPMRPPDSMCLSGCEEFDGQRQPITVINK